MPLKVRTDARKSHVFSVRWHTDSHILVAESWGRMEMLFRKQESNIYSSLALMTVLRIFRIEKED